MKKSLAVSGTSRCSNQKMTNSINSLAGGKMSIFRFFPMRTTWGIGLALLFTASFTIPNVAWSQTICYKVSFEKVPDAEDCFCYKLSQPEGLEKRYYKTQYYKNSPSSNPATKVWASYVNYCLFSIRHEEYYDNKTRTVWWEEKFKTRYYPKWPHCDKGSWVKRGDYGDGVIITENGTGKSGLADSKRVLADGSMEMDSRWTIVNNCPSSP